jgi:signal transduction histidine kinase
MRKYLRRIRAVGSAAVQKKEWLIPSFSALLGVVVAGAEGMGRLDAWAYDFLLAHTRVETQHPPNALTVGIDDASLDRFTEPLALWHRRLAQVVTALADAGAKGVALDVIPAVSLQDFAPEADLELMRALRYAKQKNVPVLLGFSLGEGGMTPLQKFGLLAAGLGYLNLFPDPDGRIRKHRPFVENEQGRISLSIALAMARLANGELQPAATGAFNIDYRLPPSPTVSFAQVHDWGASGDIARLRETFADKLAFVGIVSLKPLLDTHRIPIDFAAYSKNRTPGVLIQANMTESLMRGALLRDIPASVGWPLLATLSLTGAFGVFRGTPKRALSILGGAAAASFMLCYAAFFIGWTFPFPRMLVALFSSAALTGGYAFAQREIQLKQLIQREKMAALTRLTAGVAHEVNTPLGICVTAASLLDDKIAELTVAFDRGGLKKSDLNAFLGVSGESLALLRSNLQRTARLVQSFKQIAADQSSQTKREFELGQYLEDVVAGLRFESGARARECRLVREDEINMLSYPGVLYQVISQLMDNAWKHAFADDALGIVTIAADQSGANAIIKFQDNGQGIPAGDIPLIFDPFFTTKRGKGFAGLGLHAVYNLVSSVLQGRIECRSEVDKGTLFTIVLPKKI